MTNYRRKQMALHAQSHRDANTLVSGKAACSMVEIGLAAGLVLAALFTAWMM